MRPFLFILLVALIVVGVWERQSIASLRDERAARRAEHAAAGELIDEIATLKQKLPGETAPVPELNRSELLRLRNAVSRLRATQVDLGKLRAENERLANELKTGNTHPSGFAGEPGFVARERWTNAGNATPEAALESVVHAMRDANLDLFLTLAANNESNHWRREWQEDPVAARAEFGRATQLGFTPTGYRIVRRDETPGGKVRFNVRFSAFVEPMDIEFQPLGNGWVLSNDLRL